MDSSTTYDDLASLWDTPRKKARDEEARRQARVLGLREDRDGFHREMWTAAQKISD